MSKTSTTTTVRATISRSTSSILLSPSKRRRVDGVQPHDNASLSSVKTVEEKHDTASHTAESYNTTPAEIHRWTFTKAAIAPCFVRDVFEMRCSGSRDMEYFWLGRIPCRTVRLAGIVVGVQVWEKRTVYTIDDGTAVVDCAYAHPQAAPVSPTKPKTKETSTIAAVAKSANPSFADYLPRTKTSASKTNTTVNRAIIQPPPPQRPVARVGQSVRIVGRVVVRYETRLLLIDEISRASYNDESAHWLNVSDLHRSAYYPKDTLPPFVPPTLHSTSAYASQFYSAGYPGSPSKRRTEQHTQEPGTPGSVHSSVPSTNTSPSTVASTSSPASEAGDKPPSPVRLRHPGRLHTRDLTVHTLRIYIKHYMDNAPPPTHRRRPSINGRSVSPTPSPRSSQASRRDALQTPTKYSRGRSSLKADETPRASRLLSFKVSSEVVASDTDTEDEDEPAEEDDQVYGYTLSHLRRVPELSLLAKRVVHADAHRRAKEERKKAKEAADRSQPRDKANSSTAASSAATSTSASSRHTDPADPKATASAAKKLFRQAIRTLFQDGSIVLWEGPTRPLPTPALDPLIPSSFSSALWKANNSTSSSVSLSSSAGTSKSSRNFPAYEDWDEDAPLSDPDPGEEAYVPLTPVYFSRVLEQAISSIITEASAAPTSASGDATPKAKPARPKSTSLIERLRAQEAAADGGGAVAGPTAAELLAWLRSSDERWDRVGLWSVEEALEWGRREGRLWCVGMGRWEVCG
ncbi:hypothetical protein C2E23DRAFT_756768 [Lenzites betulinus]|nr:hypothetical protein C2E23DRAFT_756768 [Lenzites betulinus]